MPEVPAPMQDLLLAVAGAVVAGLLLTLVLLAVRHRRRRTRAEPMAAVPEPQPQPQPQPGASPLDVAALIAAVAEAESEGATRRLPGLYLSLAQWRIESGETRAAEDLLRKCVLGASSQGIKETHAKARVALGDIAQAAGDPVTACEHWQIARLLYHELRQRPEHDAVDQRMLRNGCPTDWVLTDF